MTKFNLDVALFRMLNGLAERSMLLDNTARFLTLAGWGGIVWFVISLVVLLLGWQTPAWRVTAFGTMGVVTVSGGLDTVIKLIMRRPRPPLSLPDTRLLLPLPNSYSFLSGHTLSSFAAATFLLLANQRLGGPAWAGPALYLLAAAIGWSRIHVGHHYPVDVLAGWASGMGLGLLAWSLLQPWIK